MALALPDLAAAFPEVLGGMMSIEVYSRTDTEPPSPAFIYSLTAQRPVTPSLGRTVRAIPVIQSYSSTGMESERCVVSSNCVESIKTGLKLEVVSILTQYTTTTTSSCLDVAREVR